MECLECVTSLEATLELLEYTASGTRTATVNAANYSALYTSVILVLISPVHQVVRHRVPLLADSKWTAHVSEKAA